MPLTQDAPQLSVPLNEIRPMHLEYAGLAGNAYQGCLERNASFSYQPPFISQQVPQAEIPVSYLSQRHPLNGGDYQSNFLCKESISSTHNFIPAHQQVAEANIDFTPLSHNPVMAEVTKTQGA